MLTPTAPENMDVGFVLTCAALVFLMQAGFCMLESGMIRAKNSINVAVKNLLDFAISMLAFAAFGFSIMFGASQFGLVGSYVHFWSDNDLGAFFLYQMVFCGTAATIVSGAIAERTRLSVYLLIVLLLSGATYPLIGHWCWGGMLGNTGAGWLASMGFVDWAGATVVHVVGGFAALAAVIAIGPRRNYRRSALTGGHSLTLAIMGCFLLWFGWWGFNGGSGMSAGDNVSLVLLNTNLGAVSGLLAAALWSVYKTGKTDVVHVISGALAGLVSVTGACHVISPISAILAGSIGAIIALMNIEYLKRRNVDDAVGAFGVHGAAGIWGTLVFAIFAPDAMLSTATRLDQLGVQALATAVAATFTFATTYSVLCLVAQFTKLRVKANEERLGLNVVEHGATNEVTDLLGSMHQHRHTGDFTSKLDIDTDTEVGQIAHQYNAVIERVNEEVHGHEQTNISLQSEKLRLQSVLEFAGVGIYQLDEHGHFQSANTTLLETFGYPSVSQLQNQETPFTIPWHNDSPETIANLQTHFRSGKPIKDLETQCNALNGEARWLLESIVPIRDESGRLVTWLGTVHDVTERKQTMLAAVEIAEAKSKAKGEFLANMSHEIRTPLNGVIGMLDLMATSDLERREENYVQVARSSAETLLALINDVLDFSKIEAGKLELEAVDFDLRDLMESTAEHFAVRAHMKGLEMNCELPADLPYRVNGDPERLRQVIVNLMGNAIKFTETGEINLRVARRGDVIRFGVQDTGIGISGDAQQSLFESFVQADVSTTRRYGGTGLGLSIGSQLVIKMGGRLKVDSVLGQGSEFWFELPMPVIDADQPEAVQTEQMRSGLSNLNVLIVDDNDTNCEILQNQLANWGLQSSVCNQSTAAVQKMLVAERLEKPFDLVILDFCMPDMNGRDVAIEFQQHPSIRDIPIIMLSSNHDLMSQSELEEAGINLAMTKPARQNRLFDSIVSLAYANPISSLETPSTEPVETQQSSVAVPIANEANAIESPGRTVSSTPPLASDPFTPAVERRTSYPGGSIAAVSNAEAVNVETQNAGALQVGPAQVDTLLAEPMSTEPMRTETVADVLIAEDNQVNQMVVQQMLVRLGYTCHVANDGKEALERVQSGRYSLVLMDGHMPVMDGLAATKAIRNWEQSQTAIGADVMRTPIVALTANVVSGVRQECLDAGMDDYLCKPITLERLKDIASKYAGRGNEMPSEDRAPLVTSPSGFAEATDLNAEILSVDNLSVAEQVVVESQPTNAPPMRSALPTASMQAEMSSAAASTTSVSVEPVVANVAPPVQSPPAFADHPLVQPAAAGTMDSAWFDNKALLERCGGDVSFQQQILTIMRDTLPTRVSDLQDAGKQNDWGRMRTIAHQLRGAAGDSSLVAVHTAAGVLEQQACEGTPQEIAGAFLELESRIESTLDLLEKLLAQ